MAAFEISARARHLMRAGMPKYVEGHMARRRSSFDPDVRPDGYIGLCVAENNLMWDRLEGPLTTARPLPPEVTGYDDMAGTVTLRTAIAALFEERIFGRPVSPDSVVTMAGAGAVLDGLFHVIADPGDGVLVPTPSYAGFWPDLEGRNGLRIVPVERDVRNGFALSLEQLDRALEAAPVSIRALLYTNPDNPIGTVAPASRVREIQAWCQERGIHLVADEIYALSVFGSPSFSSVGREPLGDGTHVVWAISKDFGMSGLRCGALVTENQEVRESLASIAMWSAVSTHTQAVIADMLADGPWVDAFVSENRRRLGERYRSLAAALDRAAIPHIPAAAGFFTMIDLRQYLASPTWEAEDALWNELLDQANVNLTPGSACRSPEPGFFRLCFASVPQAAIPVAVERLATVLDRRMDGAEDAV